MTYKGIARGDTSYRHFTFTDEDILIENGITYYKVNYGKNKLEGPEAEDEIGYLKYDDIIFLGGNRPAQMKVEEPKVKTKNEPEVEPKKENETKPTKKSSGRPKKVKEEQPKIEVVSKNETTQWISGTDCSDRFEYRVCEFNSKNIDELESGLNKYGNEGWELCGFDTNKSLFSEMTIITILKRKRIE